ncbi:MAG: hypothetical protein HYV16_08510 [Gammaproteobacteria bacterium]|nr:hypothetical protein [Gammaproteobacteria bacterium]
MKARMLSLYGILGVLALLGGCAATGPAHLGSDLSGMEASDEIKYCSPGSAIVHEIHGDRLIPPARPYDGGTCK